MQNTFTIGALAEEFRVTLRTLRFYEDKGLIHPRREGAHRLYSERDRARLKLILLGKSVGFSLSEIKEMMAAYDLKDGRPPELKETLGRLAGHVEILRRKQHDLDQAIEALKHTSGLVAGLLRVREGRAGEARLEAAE